MAEFDEYKESYEADIERLTKFSGKTHGFFVQVKADYLADILKREITTPGGIRLLDVGCGHGMIHPMLRSSGLPLQITGIDVAAEVIDLARPANPDVRYDVYAGEVLPYETGAFDAAVTITVMHHVPPAQWSRFLAEMKRVVRPGGVVVVFEHNPYNPFTAKIVRACPIDKDAVLLPSRHLSRLMQDSGLDAVETRFILFTPFDSPPFRAFDRFLGWLPLGAQYYAKGRVPASSGR
jgi:SAM-dependent methyltransferase